MTPRESCGFHTGLLLHRSAGEPPCGTCLKADALRKLDVEAIPTKPSPVVHKRRASDWPPVTREEAERHCAELLAAVEPFPLRSVS